MMGKIILASSSPRRQNILKETKLKFEVKPSRYEEDHTQTVFSYDFIEKLAYNKALEVAQRTPEEALVIGADTMVVIDNEILGKPKDEEEAISMMMADTKKQVEALSQRISYEKGESQRREEIVQFITVPRPRTSCNRARLEETRQMSRAVLEQLLDRRKRLIDREKTLRDELKHQQTSL